MDKKEIKDYLKRVYELGTKLVGEDKETYTWLIYGYNQCAKLLNETEQQCKKQKEVIDKATEWVRNLGGVRMNNDELIEYTIRTSEAIKEEIKPKLIDYFYKKQERIEYLERSNNRREDTIFEQSQKISDLEDNWKKIKEYIRKNIIYDNVGMKILDPSPLEDYIQELEGSDSNE